jgi:hypothetical protein
MNILESGRIMRATSIIPKNEGIHMGIMPACNEVSRLDWGKSAQRLRKFEHCATSENYMRYRCLAMDVSR